jgi:hypothetical protein
VHKKLLIILCTLLSSAIVEAKPKPAAKPAANELAKIMMGIPILYKMVNDTLAVIQYEGVNITSYNLIFQKTGNLFLNLLPI